jgi:hypothetical protein
MLRATPTTAAITGAYCAVIALVLGPLVDAPGSFSTLWLVLATALVAVPAYLFVFGVPRDQRVGLWVLQPEFLKRIVAWFIGSASVAAVATVAMAAFPSA